jgi:hypothetical protein
MIAEVKQFFRKVKHVIIKTYQYFRYVCKNSDYDWDFDFFYDIMQWKLELMSKTIKQNNFVESTDRIVKQIDYAVYLIKQLKTKEYEEKIYSSFYEKYGKLTTEFKKIDDNFTEMLFWYSKIPKSDEELRNQADKDMRYRHLEAAKRRKDLKNRLFRHLEKHVEGWWD